MKKTSIAILIIFLIAFAHAQSQEKVLVISLNYNYGELSFENAFTQQGVFASDLSFGNVRGTIFSNNNIELFNFKFELGNLLVIENVGEIEEKNFKHVLILPFFEDAEKILFFNEDTKQTLIVPIAFLSNACGNGTCNTSEAFGNCPIDCPSGGNDSYCDRVDDNICDVDCDPNWLDNDCIEGVASTSLSPEEIDKVVEENTPANEPTLNLTPLLPLIGFAIIAVIAIMAFTYFTKKKEEDDFIE